MFKFLRFEIGGISALLWTVIFVAPYIRFDKLKDLESAGIITIIFSSLIISLPIGNYIHQIADSLFNPFLKKRARFFERRSLSFAKCELGDDAKRFYDSTLQCLYVVSSAASLRWPAPNSTIDEESRSATIDFDISVVRENILNRYSYYYARIESGVFAPVVAGLFAYFIHNIGTATAYLNEEPTVPVCSLVIGAVIVAAGMLWRVPQLFKELDDLEITMIKAQRFVWKQMIPPQRH